VVAPGRHNRQGDSQVVVFLAMSFDLGHPVIWPGAPWCSATTATVYCHCSVEAL